MVKMAANVQRSLNRSSTLFEATAYHASPFQRKLASASKNYYIIHDLDDTHKDRQYTLECQLEYALERKYGTVVLESADLGFEVVRWIRTGNFLHKTSVLSGLFSLAACGFFPSPVNLAAGCIGGVVSVGCTVLYNLSWHRDPCCKYQLDYSLNSLAKIPRNELSSPRRFFILMWRDDHYRCILHSSVALLVTGMLSWHAYRYVSM